MSDRDKKIDDGWAVWEGGKEWIQGLWPFDKIGPNEHAHAHRDGPFFNHSHAGGQTPHDHEPGDRRIPAWGTADT